MPTGYFPPPICQPARPKRQALRRLAGHAVTTAVAVWLALPAIAQVPPDQQSALDACIATAGVPDAGVPVSAAALQATLDALDAALPDCRIAAEAGLPEALFHMGVDAQRRSAHAEAVDYFSRAAEAGVAAAETKLGDYALFGVAPVREDAQAAMAHFQRAADAGDMSALATLAIMARLGRGMPRDPSRMVDLLRQSADGGYHFAQLRLAQVFHRGEGFPGGQDATLGIPDAAEAARYYRMAAEQGNMVAAFDLAALYRDGAEGLPADPEQRAAWTARAAEGGVPQAIAELGFLTERGIGVDADPERAADLYVQALETGRVAASGLRGTVDGRTPPWDRATAIAFQQRLAARGVYSGAIDGMVGPQTLRAADALAQGG